MKQELFNIVPKDLLKGFIVAVLTAVLTGISTSLTSGAMPTIADLKVVGIASLSAGVGYIVKNYLTNSEDKFLKKEPTQ